MQFKLSRIINLIRRDAIIYKKPLLYGLLVVLTLISFITWVATKSNAIPPIDSDFWLGWFITFLLVGGLILCSILFWEFKTAAGRVQYLSLPASNLEKLFSRSLYVLVFYPLVIALVFLLNYGICRSFDLTQALSSDHLTVITYVFGGYLTSGIVLMIYGIVFNNYVIPKAMIASFIIYIICMFIFVAVFRVVMHEFFEGMSMQNNRHFTIDSEHELEALATNLLPALKFMLWIGLPLFFWIVAYFKMKEKEA